MQPDERSQSLAASASQVCRCAMCLARPGHPEMAMHQILANLRDHMNDSERAVCVAQYFEQSSLAGISGGTAAQIGGFSEADFDYGRAVARQLAEKSAEIWDSILPIIDRLAADEDTRAWLTYLAVKRKADALGDIQMEEKDISLVLNGENYTVHMPADFVSYGNLIEVLMQENYRHERKPVDTVYDFGSYIGLGTLYFHSVYRDSEFVAVEPEKTNLKFLRTNLKLNIEEAKYKVIPSFLSAHSGHVTYGITTTDKETSMLNSLVFEIQGSSKAVVETVGLADLVNREKRYGIKIDIEGGEFGLEAASAVFSGASWVFGELHYGSWTKPRDHWLRSLLLEKFTVHFAHPRVYWDKQTGLFCISQDFTAV